jgi:ZIP family zinc transporter
VGIWTAGFWGFVGGSALILGAAIAWFVTLPQRLIASVMAIGSGVLISAVAFDLMDEAFRQGGFDSTAMGFLGGAVVYTAANIIVSRRGARHRKRSGSNPQASQPDASSNSGVAIAIGALLDGIPESVVIGVSLLGGGGVSTVTVAAVFLSNVPEGLSSAAGMKAAGRSAGYVLAMLVDTMIPEATEATHDYSGLIAVVGFLAAFMLSKSGG